MPAMVEITGIFVLDHRAGFQLLSGLLPSFL